MLEQLSIRDLVSIEQLDLVFGAGLCILTGETGAGKSILLDALGLALGRRADSALVRAGCERATVTAAFHIAEAGAAAALLDDHGLDDLDGGELVLRRMVGGDGRSRAFVNDQSVSAGFMASLGAALVEIHGQNDRLGLLDPANHRDLLDDFAAKAAAAAGVAAAFADWHGAQATLAEAEAAADNAAAEEARLADGLDALTALDPRHGEEAALAGELALLRNSEHIITALESARHALEADNSADTAWRTAARHVDDAARRAAGRLDSIAAAFGRALVEMTEASAALDSAGAALELDPSRLDLVEERLFAIRGLSRKHDVPADDLPALKARFEDELAAVRGTGRRLDELRDALATARTRYETAAAVLSKARRKAARRLDAVVADELADLHLGNATFETAIEPLAEARWGRDGVDQVSFRVATNPGSAPGPIHRIASGGELSRFMLALRAATAGLRNPATLVFDEVDEGVGGAVADAVGARLARLSEHAQVLVVTHLPQVAARADRHYRVSKNLAGGRAVTSIAALDGGDRREELARMLSGAEVTDEARAAAASLLRTGSDP